MNISKQYIAGFFDGEGCIGIYSRYDNPNTYYLRIQLTQNRTRLSSQIMKYLEKSYGGKTSEQNTLSGGVKLNWQLGITKINQFLIDIYPHLILKKRQASIALSWLRRRPSLQRTTTGCYESHPKKFLKFSKKCSLLMKHLKKGD